jgi:hypothetical protein
VSTGLLRTPRPLPGRAVPVASAAAILALALPIYAIAGWRIAGWGLAAVLWVAGELFGLVLARLRLGMANLAASGVLAFGMMFRAIAVMVVLIAVAVSHGSLALSAALLYALVYTFELGASLISYFGGATR